MKTFRSLAVSTLFITLFFIACTKKSTETEKAIQVFKGKVVQKYTNEPVPMAVVKILQVDRLANYKEVGINTQTDENGEFSFSFTEPPGNGLWIGPPGGFDSTLKAWQTRPAMVVFVTTQTISLDPSGSINFQVSDSVWTSLLADSIKIESPYKTFTSLKAGYTQNLLIEPYKTHSFTFTAYSKGEVKKKITRSIYIPNAYKSDGKPVANVPKYDISF